MQPPGVTAAENLLAENEGYSGLGVAVESALPWHQKWLMR